MNAGNDNQIDWTAATTPDGDRLVTGLTRPRNLRPPASTPSQARREVMDTLLGKHNLSAADAGGSDPYNCTGKQFRR